MSDLGVVIIGRNEGERLKRCLASVNGRGFPLVYVDSGSTDGSTPFARSVGAEVIDLDMSRRFTAARARNAGFEKLMEIRPALEYVQFIDGDCELAEGWLDEGMRCLKARPQAAAVAGRVRERCPDQSAYNRLCALEWDVPAGRATWCGGIVMMRVSALRQAGGFNPAVIAGEEPELCFRLRRAGWSIERIDAEMATHDAAMSRFGQWWRRAVRSGHALAEGLWLHGASGERYNLRPVASTVFWAAVLPAVGVLLAWPTDGLSLGLFAAYPLQWARMAMTKRARGWSASDSRLYASFMILAKPAEFWGLLLFIWSKLRRRQTDLIEYKVPRGLPVKTPGPL